MKTFACRYAIIQFAPYTETGEFANIGVALVCPQTGFFDFKLQDRRKHGRFTQFFNELPKEVFQRSVEMINQELIRTASLFKTTRSEQDIELRRDLFDHLIHPREAVVRFSKPRTLLTDSPRAELEHLFKHHIERNFATPEYMEITMEKRIKALVNEFNPHNHFKSRKIGTEEVYARFPLVQMLDDVPLKIIKPLDLNKSESMAIYDHADTWLHKVRRLKSKNLLTADLMFTIYPPNQNDASLSNAYKEVCRDLQVIDNVYVVDHSNERKIKEFATQ